MNYYKKIGQWGEAIARQYLLKKNYLIIAVHWQCREGEIDIIAYDAGTRNLVFVEVKTRRSATFGPIEESISLLKRARIAAAINRFISDYEYPYDYRCDAIFIKVRNGIRLTHLRHVDLG